MWLDAGQQPDYICGRNAVVAAWFSESSLTMTTISLCCDAGFGIHYRNDDV